MIWGVAEWHLAALSLWGLLPEDALAAFGAFDDCDPSKVPDGIILRAYKICARCACRASHNKSMKPALFSGRSPAIAMRVCWHQQQG